MKQSITIHVKRLFIMLLSMVSMAITSLAQERYVSVTGSDTNDGSMGAPWKTLEYAVAQMTSGTLWLQPGTYELVNEVIVNGNLSLCSISSDPNDTQVIGTEDLRCFTLAGTGSSLSGITIANGNAGWELGGGVKITGSDVTISECIVTNCAAKNGGGIYAAGTGTVIVNSRVVDNRAIFNGGGIYADAGEATITNCTVQANSSFNNGGGVYLVSGVLLFSEVVQNAAYRGGGVYIDGGMIEGCTVRGNFNQASYLGDEFYFLSVGEKQYVVHKYMMVGNHSFYVPAGVSEVEYLVVGGGGGGGMNSSMPGGGGGAGGMLTGSIAVESGTPYKVIVGSGGAGMFGGFGNGESGKSSKFHTVEAFGGGGGGGGATTTGGPGLDGGSGGGGIFYDPTKTHPGGIGTEGQGHDGGGGKVHHTIGGCRTAGGGGGAGGVGDSVDGSLNLPGHGGAGSYSDITGVNTPYAGGGGAGNDNSSVGVGLGGIGGGGDGGLRYADAQDGEANTGGGGGSTRFDATQSPNSASGSGGSGIVVVRYEVPGDTDLTDWIFKLRSAAGGNMEGVGAGIYVADNSVIKDSQITDNKHGRAGGGIYMDSVTTGSLVENCTIGSNLVFEAGGGIYVTGSDATLYHSLILDNTALHNGGGIYADGEGTVISNCTLQTNQGFSKGGGAFLAAGLLISCEVSQNTANQGGGIYLDGGTAERCNISRNINKANSLGNEFYFITEDTTQYVVHKYMTTGENTFIPPEGVSEVEYLVVGGGGSGGLMVSCSGGGGGAGGMLTGTYSVVAGNSYAVVVGAGGAGLAGDGRPGNDGSPSCFADIEAVGGGGGGGNNVSAGSAGRSGGSGGGSTKWASISPNHGGSGMAGQGYAGGTGLGYFRSESGSYIYGRSGGGGGGAGGPGASTDGSLGTAGNGGAGLYCDITGVNLPYAGGGAAGGEGAACGTGGIGGGGDGYKGSGGQAGSGAPNTGGGGGATIMADGAMSGSGGSGVVVLRYKVPSNLDTGMAEWLSGGNNIDTRSFGGSGSGVYAAKSSVVKNSVITGNTSGNTGGGIYLGATTAGALIENCVVCSNLVFEAGGGVFTGSDADPQTLVKGCTIADNRVTGVLPDGSVTEMGGGGCYLAEGQLRECTVQDNAAPKGGGVMGTGCMIVNCTITDNRNQRLTGDDFFFLNANDHEYAVHKFLEVGVHSFSPPEGVTEVEYLVVGGGGGGGMASSMAGGGGGAGGMLTGSIAVEPGVSYEVVVGAGGAGMCGNVGDGESGESSKFHTVEAFGGGGGGSVTSSGGPGLDGGSGGGGTRYNETATFAGGKGVVGQGNDGGAGKAHSKTGGRSAGGGGGAGGSGDSVDGTAEEVGHGGPGLYCDITGVNLPYAGGGGAGGSSGSIGVGIGGVGGGGDGGLTYANAKNGEPNTGGGGGSTRFHATNYPDSSSGSGGSGIVVVRYKLPAEVSKHDLLAELSSLVEGGEGAGCHIANGCKLINTLVSDNQGAAKGGGLYVDGSDIAFTNRIESCTIAGNQAAESGSGVFVSGTACCELWNTIIYNNLSDDILLGDEELVTFNYCCTPLSYSGVGNITGDPRFQTSEVSTYRLKGSSPCIGSGFARDWMTDAFDMDENKMLKRPDALIDMGCFQYRVKQFLLIIR